MDVGLATMLVVLTLAVPPDALADPLFGDHEIAKVGMALLKLSRCLVLEGCEIDGYRFHPVDVNEDGEREYVVAALEGCGSAGCAMALLMKQQGRWRNMAEVSGSLTVEPSTTNGFHDITLRYKHYRPEGGFEIRESRLAWDGVSQYRAVSAVGGPRGSSASTAMGASQGSRSLEGRIPVDVTFENRLQDAVLVYWIDYEGNEVLYRELLPAESYRQGTFVTHPWRARIKTTGASIKTVVVDSSTRVVRIEAD